MLQQKALAGVTQLLPDLAKLTNLSSEWRSIQLEGDLAELLPRHPARTREAEHPHRAISQGKPVERDPESPVLLTGDSHTLVSHEIHPKNAGLPEQLALEIGIPVDSLEPVAPVQRR